MALATLVIDPNALVDGADVRDALKAMSDTAREVVLTSPVSGQFPVIFVQRDALANLEVTYDDVAIV